jgi:hypothetical protein
MDLIERLQELADKSSPLQELASFDPDKCVMDDLPSDAYDERLDVYLESDLNQRVERLEELERKAEVDLREFRTNLELLCVQMKAVLTALAQGRSAIDNTDT